MEAIRTLVLSIAGFTIITGAKPGWEEGEMGVSSTDSILSSPRSRLRSVGLMSLTLMLAAVVSGVLYQNFVLARERRANHMPGHLFDVGGFRMHIFCAGRQSPTVILDSGLGDSYIAWQNVQLEIAKFVEVCSYDRAGMGYSDPSSRPRTSRVFAEELHDLLLAAGLPPPYILVGHSMAGFNVRLYAAQYRHEVAGMVLVVASHPNQLERFPPALHAMNAS
jgi:hypothetical protein